ncbi:MAG: YqeG family HAD IIIA-type phosphatase [Lachnospiraceae bacterium]
MSNFLYPSHYLPSAYEIPYEELYAKGKRALIFDIDNTLVKHGAPADERAMKLMESLKGIGFQICFLSNNKEPRVKSFNEKIGANYIFKAGKPKRSGYERAMQLMGSNKESTVFIGDQIFTDVCGANLAGIETYLVEPIDKKEEIQIVLKRYLEKPILYCYKRKYRKG